MPLRRSLAALLLARAGGLGSLKRRGEFENRTRLEPWYDEPLELDADHGLPPMSYSSVVDAVGPELSFNSHPGNLKAFEAKQLSSEVRLTRVGDGVSIRFNEVGEKCNDLIRPFADFDTRQGHGHPRCRYEPDPGELSHYKAHPIDLAIVLPYGDASAAVPDSAEELSTLEEYSAYAWRKYAKFHGYKLYLGPLTGQGNTCFREFQGGAPSRSLAWLKVCMGLELVQRHKYLLIAEVDTFVTKPLLRMEPLFERAGLLDARSGKVAALASEWGSCTGAASGGRKPAAGERNTGVLLLNSASQELLRTWFFNPDCEGECSTHDKSLHRWSFDQLGFQASVAQRYKDKITTWPSGCPINGPWGDFISRMVDSSFNHSYWHPKHRLDLMRAGQRCAAVLIKRRPPDALKRCSLCSLLPSDHVGFEVSCAPATA